MIKKNVSYTAKKISSHLTSQDDILLSQKPKCEPINRTSAGLVLVLFYWSFSSADRLLAAEKCVGLVSSCSATNPDFQIKDQMWRNFQMNELKGTVLNLILKNWSEFLCFSNKIQYWMSEEPWTKYFLRNSGFYYVKAHLVVNLVTHHIMDIIW